MWILFHTSAYTKPSNIIDRKPSVWNNIRVTPLTIQTDNPFATWIYYTDDSYEEVSILKRNNKKMVPKKTWLMICILV